MRYYLKLWIMLISVVLPAGVMAVPPNQVTNLTAVNDYQIKLTWTAPDSSLMMYQLRYSTTGDITDETLYSGANIYVQTWAPLPAGNTETKILTGLIPEKTYWFTIKSRNFIEWSSISVTGLNSAVPGAFYKVWNSVASEDTVCVAWGDYDNDGDLDQFAGNAVSESRIYRNDGNDIFAPVLSFNIANFTGASWGDCDNDGDLDILAGDSLKTRVYKNNLDGSAFALLWEGIANDNASSVAWGDCDNDGDMDQLVGSINKNEKVYRNDGNGIFSDIWSMGESDTVKDVAWGDCDNDGDLDQLISRTNISKVYRNDGNSTFNLTWTPMAGGPQVINSVAWGDYENDGDLDQLLGIEKILNPVPNCVYINTGEGNFGSKIDFSDILDTKDAVWGDYDNNGYLDFLVGKSNSYVRVCNNALALVWTSDSAYQTRSVAWGDYDNDGDLDQLIGNNNQSNVIYKSGYSLFKQNTSPSAPASFSSSYADAKLKITWPDCSDTETALAKGLYYEIRMATENITNNLRNWTISPSTGVGATPLMGNYLHGFSSATLQPGFNFSPRIGDTTYYWQARAIDTGLRRSAWSGTGFAYLPQSVPSIPVLLSPLDGSSTNVLTLNFDWSDSSDITGISCYTLRASNSPSFAGITYSSVTTGSSGALTLPEGTWYWTVRSSNTAGAYSDWATARSVSIDATPCASINDLASLRKYKSPTELSLSWTSPGDNGFTGSITNGAYRIRYSTYVPASWTDSSSNWTNFQTKYQIQWATNTPAQVGQTYKLTGLIADATYYIRIWTRDEVAGSSDWNGNWSSISNGVTTVFSADTIKPQRPAGIKIQMTGNYPEIRWSAVDTNEDASVYDDKMGYNIYRSNSLTGSWLLTGFVSVASDEFCVFADTSADLSVYYYKVRAMDDSNNESADSMICDTSRNLDIIALSADGNAVIYIPKTINGVLYKNINYDDLIIKIEKKTENIDASALAVYELSAIDSSTGEKIRYFKFPGSSAKIELKHSSTASAPSVFWFNGLEWLKVSSSAENDTVSLLSGRLGMYMLKISEIAKEFTLNKVYPRIFTPDGNGLNDYVEFQYENPGNCKVTGKVYDIRGGIVAELKEGNNYNSLAWDGKTVDGENARSGVYMYQIELSGSETKIINGTVVVAR